MHSYYPAGAWRGRSCSVFGHIERRLENLSGKVAEDAPAYLTTAFRDS